MSLVTGYDSSDSEDDGDVIKQQVVPRPAQPQQDARLSSVLPPPKHAQPARPAATTSSNKRRADKLQIRVGALNDEEDVGEDDDSVKRPKIGGGGSGLFSMLPAPSNKNPVQPPKKSTAAEHDAANNLGIGDASAGAMTLQEPPQVSGAKKTKGNNDFRAMLGLKPSKLAVPPRAKVVGTASAEELHKSAVVRPVADHKLDDDTTDAPVSQDFFSLGSDAASTSNEKAKASGPLPRTSFSVTLAPTILDDDKMDAPSSSVDEADPYEGWQQGPDDAWFPVTPAAHAQYQRFLSATADEQERGLRMAEADAGSVRIDSSRIHDTDVNAGLADWLARPSKDVALPTATTTKADSLDQRYALAAASVAQPGQARVELPEDAMGDAAKQGDKTTSMRARRKGQLTSLIAQAEENREKLEDRWARGRAARTEAQKRYGF